MDSVMAAVAFRITKSLLDFRRGGVTFLTPLPTKTKVHIVWLRPRSNDIMHADPFNVTNPNVDVPVDHVSAVVLLTHLCW